MFSSILIFIAVLSILILAHELGHFWAARRAGIWVEEFGIGLPPRIWGKKIEETIYSINLLPFGGFVRLHGEYVHDGVTKPEKAFINKNRKTRSLVVVSGVIMNFLLAIFTFSIGYSFSGIPQNSENVQVLDIQEGSPAENAGISAGDLVRKVEDEKITSVDQFVKAIEKKKGEDVTLLLEKEGDLREVILAPRIEPPEGEGPIGVTVTSTEIYFPPIWQRPFLGAFYGFQEAIFWGETVVAGFVKVIGDLFAGQTPEELAGPVGIFAITSQAARFGILALINFVGILSVNLAILNIIPFPALDGGRLLFIGIESIFGRRVLPKIETAIHTIGMIILIFLLLAITAHDIQRLISSGGISQFVDSVLR